MRTIPAAPRLLLLAACCAAGLMLAGAARGAGAGGGYVFTYFKGNGEDGLHLAWSRDGLKWEALNGGRPLLKPEVGQDKLMRDPHVMRGPDGVYHLVWTSSWSEPVLGHATSKDLIHWSGQQAVAPFAGEPFLKDVRNAWAPETVYDPERKEYIIFWSTTVTGRFPETQTGGDGGRNHRIYATTTKDFRTFTPARLFYDGGFNVIDATIVRDGGRYVMFLKDETVLPVAKKNIRLATGRSAAGPYGEASAPITGDYWAEGPSALKVGGRWVVYFDKYRDHRYGAVASSDLKNWADISERVSFPAGARHGTALRVPRSTLAALLRLNKATPQS
jgi:hypothetical protein